MTAANASIAEVANWITESSKPRRAPFGDLIPVGRFAVLVPVALDASVGDAFDAQALPLWVPATQVAPSALWPVLGAVLGQPSAADRLAALAWKVEQGDLPNVAIVGIQSPQTTLQQVCDAIQLDPTVSPLLCAPLWKLPVEARQGIEPKLTAVI